MSITKKKVATSIAYLTTLYLLILFIILAVQYNDIYSDYLLELTYFLMKDTPVFLKPFTFLISINIIIFFCRVSAECIALPVRILESCYKK